MTNPISDEQLAELADGCIDSIPCPISALYELAERLIAAEADAKRYRWLRDSGRLLGDSMDSHADNFCVVTADGEDVMWFEQLDSAIDAAMERTP
ncbi:TPA: hypothetical protein ONA95_004768 [Pseudomonas aeruginosa]|nr:hypothetical protein [Pseudomonas aeruginosa]HBO4036389.1 hypothetical protein [Pseudomonas aeruginosa]HBO4112448.1 hypothetical protein [Pseudomonas aeruginosa]HCR1670282.1 hypothetical protein [Pseudomonas aeruginosa]